MKTTLQITAQYEENYGAHVNAHNIGKIKVVKFLPCVLNQNIFGMQKNNF